MKLCLAQLNPLIGDLKGNCAKIINTCTKANKNNADLVITPELSLLGYPPRDLLFNQHLVNRQRVFLEKISAHINSHATHLAVLVGVAEPTPDPKIPRLFNSIALITRKGWEIVCRKQLLPTYDVFDEKRYFRPSDSSGCLDFEIEGKTWQIGLTICEDIWVEEKIQGQRLLGPDPIASLATRKIDLLLNLSASPFTYTKRLIRQQIAGEAAKRLNCPVIYLNQVGGNDELIFDGSSFVTNHEGLTTFSLPLCQESVTFWDYSYTKEASSLAIPDTEELLLNALVLGLRDYVEKCGFKSVVLGLSGGIDSALVAIIACAALGAENVLAILMPSPWSSESSVKDAKELAKRLGLPTETIPITALMHSYDQSLKVPLGEVPQGLTAENLQARIRGTLLMAIANNQKHLLLSTGNKSEYAVGYCTLYGDMNGGLSVIGDLYKTSVFKLCNWLDSDKASQCRRSLMLPRSGALVGKSILTKPPSAELSPNQFDSDSIPDYEILDPILQELIENQDQQTSIANQEHGTDLRQRVQKLFKQAEFKRRQAPPVLKVSDQAFGSGWRKPIAST